MDLSGRRVSKRGMRITHPAQVKPCYISSMGPSSSVQTSNIDKAATRFLPYLQEIQRKLFSLFIVVFASGIVGFIYYQQILSFFLQFFNLKGITIVLTSPYQFFDLAVNTGLATGFVVATPVFLYYLLAFLKPALKTKEYRLVIRLIPVSLVLFIAGFAFGAWVMQFVINLYSQTAIDFNIGNIWDISRFFAQVIIVGLCLGLVFQLPIVMTLLLRLKVVKREVFTNGRRYAYAAILIFAAVLPPNDVISLGILTTVPLFLYEIALLLNQSV